MRCKLLAAGLSACLLLGACSFDQRQAAAVPNQFEAPAGRYQTQSDIELNNFAQFRGYYSSRGTMKMAQNAPIAPYSHGRLSHALDQPRIPAQHSIPVQPYTYALDAPIISAFPATPVQYNGRAVDKSTPTRTTPAHGQTSLQQSLKNAYYNSPELAVEQYRIGEAQELLEQAKSQERIRLDFNAELDATQTETVFNIIDRTDSEFQIGRAASLDMSLPLYQGGKLKSQKRSAEAGVKAANSNFSAAEIDLSKQTALAYLNVYKNRELLKIYRDNLALLERQRQSGEILFQNGEYTIADKALIATRLSAVMVEYELADAQLKNSESIFKNLVGQAPPGLLPTPNLVIPKSLYEVKTAALNSNPDIVAAQILAESAQHNLDIAKSGSKPNLSLHARLRGAEGQTNTIARDSAAEVRLRFNVPLISGGENKSKERQALLAQSRATMEIRNAMSDVETQIERSWANLHAAERSNALYVGQIGSANDAFQTISRQKEVGLATILDVISVEQSLLDAKLNQVKSATSVEAAKIELLSLMGRTLYPN
ncbi:MAG: TolC family protein [Hellea sp.]|nr:TolC family protein [Hellea sp.]